MATSFCHYSGVEEPPPREFKDIREYLRPTVDPSRTTAPSHPTVDDPSKTGNGSQTVEPSDLEMCPIPCDMPADFSMLTRL